MKFYSLSIQGFMVPYFELIPSITITRDDVLLAWMFWGLMIKWQKVSITEEE